LRNVCQRVPEGRLQFGHLEKVMSGNLRPEAERGKAFPRTRRDLVTA